MSAIDYDLKKIRAFAFDVDGVLSPSTIPMSDDGMPMRMLNIKDGYALQLAVKCGYRIAIITGGRSDAIVKRYNALGIRDIYQGCAHKLDVFLEWISENNLKPEEVLYMGDDIPDLQVMRHAGLPCSPFDACWEAKQTSVYVSKITGGYGCVRDVVEQVMKAHDDWMREDKAFGW